MRVVSTAIVVARLSLAVSGSNGGCTAPRFDEEGELADGAAAVAATDARVSPERELAAGDARATQRDASAARKDASAPQKDASASQSDAPPSRDETAGDQADAGGGPSVDEAGDAGPPLVFTDGGGPEGCLLSGFYAVRSVLQVSWEGKTLEGIYPLVREGSGVGEVFARIEIDGSRPIMVSGVTLCGAKMPEFSAGDPSFINEHYGFYYPDDVWEQMAMPRWDLLWERSCETATVGCKFSSRPFSATIGATSFVEAPSALTTQDHDGDGHAAVTIRARSPAERTQQGAPYSFIPLSYGSDARAERLFAVALVNGTYDATLTTCDTFRGDFKQARIAMRAAGCLARNRPGEDEVPCTSAQVRFVAGNVPQLDVTSASFEARRISDTADCAGVRSVWSAR